MEILLSVISVPVSVIIIWGILNIIGEILEKCGKIVPTFFKMRKYFQRKKEEKKAKEQTKKAQQDFLLNAPELLDNVKTLLADVNSHYSKDNIEMRDRWMQNVDTAVAFMYQRANTYDCTVNELEQVKSAVDTVSDKLDMLSGYSCKLVKEIYRNRILDFAHEIINARNWEKPLTISQERFNKIRATYDEYEQFLVDTNDTNGQVEDAMKVIKKAENGEIPNIVIDYNLD